MKYCKRCVTPSTRPRITFNQKGICNACTHHEHKQKHINWNTRWKRLEQLCNKYRKNSGWDVIVPCSGGKDGTYVAWNMKHKLKMHPLCITLVPQMQTWIGQQNLQNFIYSGFDHILLTPNPKIYRQLAKIGFVEQGRPKMPFVTGISTAVFQYAVQMNIPFIMYGEEGESEYGGASDAKEKIDRKYLVDYYYSGKNPAKYGSWWKLPSQKELDRLYPTHWSKFEDWDPEKHARLASEMCDLQMLVGGSIGTFTNYAQLDDCLQDLHAFLMFVKFGFGRATSDVSIEIRRGRMTRSEGVRVVNRVDGQFPLEYFDAYLDYFEMNEDEFWKTVDGFVNWEVLRRSGRLERPFELIKPVK